MMSLSICRLTPENFINALASAWKTTPANLIKWNPVCDISNPKDNTIDFKDVDIFTDNWLYKE